MGFERTVLPNGMTVISYTMPSVRSVSLGLWFNVGSRDERPDQAGLTHFMEHMMFKGTPSKGPLDISMHFDRLGAELNAFTAREYTCYYSRFVDGKLEDALSVLAEMVIESTFSQDAIDTEREVVIEEIARSEDAPDDFVYELYSRNNLAGHPCGLPVLGTRERVGGYEHADCVAFHAEHYHAGNLTLAAAGNVQHEALVALAERLFTNMRPGTKAERELAVPEYSNGLFCQKRDIEQAHIVYGVPWFGLGNERRYISSVLTTILGGSMSSRLFQEVREKRGLAYSIYAMQAGYQGAGQWCIYAGTRPSNVKEVVQLIRAELERIASVEVSADELSRNVDLICGQMLLGLETTNSHMVRLGKRETLGLPQATPEEQTLGYRSVTAAQVKELAQDMLMTDPCIAVISPYGEEKLSKLVF
jgi:predicted Zn-dependent peptidase